MDGPHSIYLLLTLQLLCHFVRPFQVFEIALHPVHLARVTKFLELFYGLLSVLLFLRYQEDLRGIVLEKMGCDAESDSCGATGDDIYLMNSCQCCLVGATVND